MIEITEITKTYGDIVALDSVNLRIDDGEIFGFIGADGAGKTTLFRILTTLILPDSGSAFINGRDVVKDYKEIRKILGYMPGRFSLYQDLTIEENLNFFASVFGTTIEENYDLIKDIYQQIEPFKKRRAGKLSGGMKQKLALSCALIHKPEVLVLDEPTTGVDPVSRKEFWNILNNLKKAGITIIVSTPYMDEASLCDRVALIQKGRIMKIETPAEIVKQHKAEILAIKSSNKHELISDLRNHPACRSVFSFGEYLHFTPISDNISDKLKIDLEQYLREKNHRKIEMKPVQPTIEDCFMALMRDE